MIPYGLHSLNEDDIQAVVGVLKSDWLTQGPKVEEFEKKLAAYCDAKYAVVVCNGTAALHAAYFAVDLKKGDQFITSPLTFAATVNVGIQQGGEPVFVDIDELTGNIDVARVEENIRPETKVIVPVDYAGRPADLDYLLHLGKKYKIPVLEDACHAIGAVYHNKKIGSVSDLTIFSFHPVKNITTGEGGAILTNDINYYERMKKFITHGITKKFRNNHLEEPWYYEMQDLGLNYRLTDIQCALGISQLKKLDNFLSKRREIVQTYREHLRNLENIKLPLFDTENIKSGWHLFPIRLAGNLINNRTEIFNKLREAGVGVQVHYIPVYLHPYYQKIGFQRGLCPLAEQFYQTEISLPLFPSLTLNDQMKVINILKELVI